MDNVAVLNTAQAATGGRRLQQTALGPQQTATVTADVTVPAQGVQQFTGAA